MQQPIEQLLVANNTTFSLDFTIQKMELRHHNKSLGWMLGYRRQKYTGQILYKW